MTRMQAADRAKDLVAEHFGIERGKLLNGGRAQVLAGPRHVLAWLLRSRGMSYPDVGAEMAGRDHTTSMNSVAVVGQKQELLDAALVLHAKLELEIEMERGTLLKTENP